MNNSKQYRLSKCYWHVTCLINATLSVAIIQQYLKRRLLLLSLLTCLDFATVPADTHGKGIVKTLLQLKLLIVLLNRKRLLRKDSAISLFSSLFSPSGQPLTGVAIMDGKGVKCNKGAGTAADGMFW